MQRELLRIHNDEKNKEKRQHHTDDIRNTDLYETRDGFCVRRDGWLRLAF